MLIDVVQQPRATLSAPNKGNRYFQYFEQGTELGYAC